MGQLSFLEQMPNSVQPKNNTVVTPVVPFQYSSWSDNIRKQYKGVSVKIVSQGRGADVVQVLDEYKPKQKPAAPDAPQPPAPGAAPLAPAEQPPTAAAPAPTPSQEQG